MPTHYSLFDGSLQGFTHKYLPVFALQGHPEAGPGPSDAKKLFQNFIATIEICKKYNKNSKIVTANKTPLSWQIYFYKNQYVRE